jgi:hypothetical protein
MTLADRGTLDPMVGQWHWPSDFRADGVKRNVMQAL